MFGMCIDKRDVGSVAIAAAGVLLVAPQLIAATLPILLIAICPLSMLLMGKAMMSGGQRLGAPAPEPIEASYLTIPALDSDQQVAVLQAQLQVVTHQQAMLSDQLARLQGDRVDCSSGPSAEDREPCVPAPGVQGSRSA